MQKLCLTVARVLLAGWLGGAVLFVVTSIAEQSSPDLDAATKGTLALIRFPWYYGFGFVLLAGGLVLGTPGLRHGVAGPLRRGTFVATTTLALLVMAADLVFVYRPLALMTRDSLSGDAVENDATAARFAAYHEASKNVNLLGLALAALGTLLVCHPTWEPEDVDGRERR